MANKKKATGSASARQDAAPPSDDHDVPEAGAVSSGELEELVANLNWLVATLRAAVGTDAGREVIDRLARLLQAPWIPNAVATDMEGWAALMALKNGRSFSKLRVRRKIPGFKPGQTWMFHSGELIEHSGRPNRDGGPPGVQGGEWRKGGDAVAPGEPEADRQSA